MQMEDECRGLVKREEWSAENGEGGLLLPSLALHSSLSTKPLHPSPSCSTFLAHYPSKECTL